VTDPQLTPPQEEYDPQKEKWKMVRKIRHDLQNLMMMAPEEDARLTVVLLELEDLMKLWAKSPKEKKDAKR
jgi:hypothetical protein